MLSMPEKIVTVVGAYETMIVQELDGANVEVHVPPVPGKLPGKLNGNADSDPVSPVAKAPPLFVKVKVFFSTVLIALLSKTYEAPEEIMIFAGVTTAKLS